MFKLPVKFINGIVILQSSCILFNDLLQVMYKQKLMFSDVDVLIWNFVYIGSYKLICYTTRANVCEKVIRGFLTIEVKLTCVNSVYSKHTCSVSFVAMVLDTSNSFVITKFKQTHVYSDWIDLDGSGNFSKTFALQANSY